MKKSLAMLLCVLMIATSLTGCLGAGTTPATSTPASGSGDGSTAAPSGEIDYNATFELRFTGSLGGDERTALLDEAAAKLKEKWPNVTVVNESTGDYSEKMKLAFSSGEGQDLVYLDDLNQQMLEQGGYLMDITQDIIDRGWMEKNIEGAVEFNNLRHPGTNYSVPFLMAPVLVYYNKDIFTDIGATVPTTVEEFEKVMQLAKDKGYIPTECGGDQMYQILWVIEHLVQNQAPKSEVDDWYYMKNASDNVKTAFIDSYKRIDQWYKAGYFRQGFEGLKLDDVTTMFAQGKSAMVLGGDWDLPNMEASGLNLGAFTFPPVKKDGSPVIVNAVDGAWALNKNLDANKKAAALDWIDLFFEPEFVTKWYELGFTPSVVGDYSGAQVSSLKKDSAAAVVGTQMGFYLDNVKPGFLDHFNKQTQMMIQGELTPEGVWDALNTEWSRKD